MKNGKNEVDFFLGANSPNGFHSLYSEVTGPIPGKRLFLIKGTAGSGKSSMMRRIAGEMAGRETLVERLHCSSDPDSLDGVILHKAGCTILDATPPHVVEPAYPGGYESIVNICGCLDEELLEERLPDLVALQTANSAYHQKCRGLMKCADILLSDNAAFAESCTNFAKIQSLAGRIAKKELKKATGKLGEERRRLLSAVTNQGIVSFPGTVEALCSRIVLIQDDYRVSSNALLQSLRRAALENGYLVYSCYCPLAPESRLEHLLLPELGLGFLTQSRFLEFPSIRPDRVIHFTRFTDMEQLRRRRQFLNFNRKAAAELLSAAIDRLKQAKLIHDQLEEQYHSAVDFPAVTELGDLLQRKISNRY